MRTQNRPSRTFRALEAIGHSMAVVGVCGPSDSIFWAITLPPALPPSLLARRLCQSRREIRRRAEGTVMRRRHFPTSSHGCFSWRNSATALFCHFPELLACLYENGPPVMLMGIVESLSESARKTSDWPVLYSTPDTGLLSTRTRSSVGSNATVLL